MDSENTPIIKTSYTTANGDGLTFDPYAMNIFDEVDFVIEGKDGDVGKYDANLSPKKI